MTRADKIRSMSDEELAQEMVRIFTKHNFQQEDVEYCLPYWGGWTTNKRVAIEEWAEWLNREVGA